MKKKIQSALISVFHKEGLRKIASQLKKHNITVYSTGGTAAYLASEGLDVIEVESITDYPSILGGRVKTLHPKVFGGILARQSDESDQKDLENYSIPTIDLVVVDLYPFEETVRSGGTHQEIIEKIDIGGISLIRAAAKNYQDVVIIPSKNFYQNLENILSEGEAATELNERKHLAAESFKLSSHYDGLIKNYFIGNEETKSLRYGENPHQKGFFRGKLNAFVEQKHGKELSYNNLLDIDSAMRLIRDFKHSGPTFAVIKHNNACGLATRDTVKQAYLDALAGDPVSAFGGILISNREIDLDCANEINKLFCEVVIAPAFSDNALELLKSKKNRIILIDKEAEFPNSIQRSALNGFLEQEADRKISSESELKQVTKRAASADETRDLLFANRIAKHTKSNTIVLAKNEQLLASGVGQTSRVDALKQAIVKAKNFGFDLNGSVMASDAFFPFPDCVEIANEAGIKAVIHPGGSIRDQDSIDFCDEHQMAMVLTGTRHFRH